MSYFDRVNPGAHGIAQPWYFPVQSIVKKIKKNKNLDQNINASQNEDLLNNTNNSQGIPVYLEDESVYQSARGTGISIRNLCKNFRQLGMVKTAVKNLNLNIYDGQITVLLGHNGAGKSTTISMITGLIKPTSGQILVNAIDMVEHTKEARKCIGLCPQHNLLFEELTVYQHLVFFAKLKENFSEEEIDQMLDIINLKDKKNALAKTLSGGMKRKLSIAIAFIGNSKIVILDEPSKLF
jgi:ATP-binding cassette subfamily A (ABC1) protein 3